MASTGGEGEIEAEELAFADEDERLPWLEADDDFEEPGVPAGKMAAFVLGALVLLAAIIGGGYWLLQDGTDPALVADGSTIEAPEGPYKEKPDDPGGATTAGTGDSSFAVAEGRSPTARVANDDAPPRPSIDIEQRGVEGPGGVGVQVGAYSSRERAEQGWQTLAARHEALSGVNHRVEQGTADGSPIFRLQAVAGGTAAARELCNALKAGGADCQIKN
jgi:hypothetical protein